MAASAGRTLLLLDDEPAQARLVTAIAARAGWRTVAVSTGDAALALLGGHEAIDALLIDVWRPAGDTAGLVAAMRARQPGLAIVVLTAQASIALAVEAMRAGAGDFLMKPIAPDRLMAALDAATLDGGGGGGELRPLAEKAQEPLGFDEIVGSAPAFRAALAVAAKAARSRAPALILGEPGTGKELIARAIHAASVRARKLPVVLHCAALPTNLACSELFGHERGAFTGAFDTYPGRLAAADGSTLVLADVAALPADAQDGLVAFLDDGIVMPIGGKAARAIDVRLVMLAQRPLAAEVAAGRLRPELAERLSAVVIRVPALRQRTTDLPALARHLLARIGRQPGMRSLGLTDEALALLAGHHWPGNVRQLHAALFRAAVGAEGAALTPADFPEVARARSGMPAEAPHLSLSAAAGILLYETNGHLRPLGEIEADIIRLAIGHYEGRMSEVARRLGIGRSTLYRKLVELGLDSAA